MLIPESGYNTILHQIINNSSTDYQYIHDIDILSKYLNLNSFWNKSLTFEKHNFDQLIKQQIEKAYQVLLGHYFDNVNKYNMKKVVFNRLKLHFDQEYDKQNWNPYNINEEQFKIQLVCCLYVIKTCIIKQIRIFINEKIT